MTTAPPASTPSPAAGGAPDSLKRGSITLPGVLMQSVTAISPAIAGLFTVAGTAGQAGVTAPLAYLGAFVIALLLGSVLVQFSKHISSVGSYFTFTSRSLGVRAGIVVGWVYLLFYPVVVAQVGSFMGDSLEQTLKAEYGITFPWWIFMVVIIAFVAFTAWRGVELSIKLLIVMGAIEIIVVLALSIWGFVLPGDGGITLDWVIPSNAPSTSGLFLGVVFAIFALTGWDAAAPLAEESVEPRRTVPRAVIGSIVILGVFLVIASWGQMSGFGANDVDGFVESGVPGFVLAKEYWGPAWVIVPLALLNSAIAVAIAATNASVRFILGLSRAGVLPASLSKVHPRFKTPTNAIILQTVVNVLLGIVLPFLIGVGNVYGVTGFWFTFSLAVVYVISNVGLFVFYRKQHRDEFNWFLHFVVPLLGIIGLVVLVFFSVYPALPPFPISLAPIVVLAWTVIGIVVMLVVYRGPQKAKIDAAARADSLDMG